IQRSWDNIPVRYNGQTVWAEFTATSDGYSGYIPRNAAYIGGGRIQPVGYGGPPRFSPSRGNSPPDTNIGQLNGVTDLSERDLLQNAPQQQTRETPGSLLGLAIQDAIEALKSKTCRNLFGSNVDPESELLRYSEYPSNVLGSLTLGDLGAYQQTRDASGNLTGRSSSLGAVTTGILGSFVNANGARISRFDGANIVINNNANGAFISGYRDYLGVGATDQVYRAITIIHELGHALRIRFGAYESPIVDDTGPGTEGYSRANSDLVYAACFSNTGN
ncbi:MAG: hypothetical protein ACRD6X_21140, partial [Pyrinomonadaceae bacterium]